MMDSWIHGFMDWWIGGLVDWWGRAVARGGAVDEASTAAREGACAPRDRGWDGDVGDHLLTLVAGAARRGLRALPRWARGADWDARCPIENRTPHPFRLAGRRCHPVSISEPGPQMGLIQEETGAVMSANGSSGYMVSNQTTAAAGARRADRTGYPRQPVRPAREWRVSSPHRAQSMTGCGSARTRGWSFESGSKVAAPKYFHPKYQTTTSSLTNCK